jgi:hypothetical protein
MKLNMKSQKKQTHNTVLTESGVFGLICIKFQKDRVSITIDQKGPAHFLSSNFIFIQTSTCWNFNRSRIFFSYKKKEIKRFNSLSLSFFRENGTPSFICCSSSKNIIGRHLSLFDTGNLPLHMLSASDAPLHQLGYQPGRFGLIICLKSVIILH